MTNNLTAFEKSIEQLPSVPDAREFVSGPEADTPKHHLQEADNLRAMVEGLPGNSDENVADLVKSTNEFFTCSQASSSESSPDAFQAAVIADEVGAMYLLGGGDTSDTAAELSESPHEPLVIAMTEIAAADPSGEAVEMITEKIDNPEQSVEDKGVGPSRLAVESVRTVTDRDTPEKVLLLKMSTEGVAESLDACKGDAYERVGTIAALMKTESNEVKSFDNKALYALAEAIPKELIPAIIGGEHKAEFQSLISQISETNITGESVAAHMKIISMLEYSEQTSALSWRNTVRNGGEVSDAARTYIDKKYLAQAVLRGKELELNDKLGTHIFAKERQEAIDAYRLTAEDAIKYVLDPEQNPDLMPIASGMMTGDIRDYGFREDLSPTPQGARVIESFVANIDALGKERAREMHEKLGTVNFGIYSPDTLKGIIDIFDNPAKYREHGGVRAIIRGKNGDYNNAFASHTNRGARAVLVFEVGALSDIDKVNGTLESLSLGINRLTLAGHGGERGIHLSKNALLARNRSAFDTPAFQRLISKIRPDENGQKPITLDSCSQGRRYDAKGSTAEIIADMYDDTVVSAAPRVSRLQSHPVNLWEYTVGTNRYYEFTDVLKRYPNIPFSSKITAFLLDPKRDKIGVLRVTKDGTTFDKSGSIIT